MYYADDTVGYLRNGKQIVVFGAGIMALGVVNCLREKPYQLNIECCLVSDLNGNPSHVSGIPVIDFSTAEYVLGKDAVIIVAAIGKGLESMEKSLRQRGYFQLISLTYEGDLWNLLRGDFYREYCMEAGKPYLTIEDELDRIVSVGCVDKDKIHIYTAMCHVDKVLEEDVSRFSWELPIQVGAALTDQRICDISDDTGENISQKNRQYCELTALYWIWKNDTSEYVGLGHYRRHFELDEEMLEKLVYSDIDVVLTIPIFDFPNVGEVYWRDHVKEDWLVMIDAIKKLFPEYLEAAIQLQDGKFYYAYNMFIMKHTILDKYCQWLFPILSYCEEHCKEKKDTYQNRYIGFLAEHLMSIYFLYHEKEFKIVHARKHFIEK